MLRWRTLHRSPKNAIDIQHKSKDYPEVTLFVKALAPPKPVDVSKWDEGDKVNPFFLVKDTTDKKQANVCFKMVKQDGVSFSILTNQKKTTSIRSFLFSRQTRQRLPSSTAKLSRWLLQRGAD